MKVYKFGGASIASVFLAKNTLDIIRTSMDDTLMVVISAKGKTTNRLEEIARTYFRKDREQALHGLALLLEDHITYACELLGEKHPVLEEALQQLTLPVEHLLQQKPDASFDYYYDQVVSLGELWSTRILAQALQQQNIPCTWLDIRQVLKTDATYRDAQVDWQASAEKLQSFMQAEPDPVILTQGFIGSTRHHTTVTLGREGSDYTAAVLATLLQAEHVTIWKDVPCLLNADPKIFPDTIPIHEISFHEVIEMAYYGAQVIHPKTIKPLYNAGIPLYVRCFLDREARGTLIHDTDAVLAYPPILVLKTKQVLLQVSTRDYSFMNEDHLSRVYQWFHECRLKINLMQHGAISFVACVDSDPERLEALLQKLEADYKVRRNEDLFLFTVRHYTQEIFDRELSRRNVLLEQRTRHTVQMVVQ